jgi:hypothetical protein
MAEIAVDFLLGPDCVSRIIARYGANTGGWSHCASVLKDGRYLDARSDIVGGVPAGVHIRDPSKEKWVRKRRATLQVTDAEYADWEANLRAKITDAYGRSDIINIILGRPGHHNGQWICSALAINAVQHIARAWSPVNMAGSAMQRVGHIPFPLPVEAHEISPDMALTILATAGFTIGPEIHS